MAEKEEKKLSYEELEQVAAQLKQNLDDCVERLRKVDNIREVAYLCTSLLPNLDKLEESTQKKVLKFIDNLIPVVKEQQGPEQQNA